MGQQEGMRRREFLRIAGAAAASVAVAGAAAGCTSKASASSAKVVGWQDVNIAKEVDVLIIGAGGAGLCAALNTTSAGLTTLLVEKAITYGGAGNLAAGISIWPAGSKYAKERGATKTIDEVWESYAEYYKAKDPQPRLWETLGKAITYSQVELHDLLYDMGVKWMTMPEDDGVRPTPGSGATSYFVNWYVPDTGLGSYHSVYEPINDTIVKAGAEFMFRTEVTDFIVNENNEAVGVRCKADDGTITDVGAKAILIATGGFCGSQPMIAKYLPDWAKLPTAVNEPCGEGILLGQSIGGALEGMENYNTLDPSNAVLTCTAYFAPTYQVAQSGKRFCKEVDQHAMAGAMIAAGQPCWWSVWDSTLANSQFKSTVDTYFGKGGVTANSVEELAEKTGMPLEPLKATFAEYEALAVSNKDDKFARKRFNVALKPPYYALMSVAERYKTQGGLRLNAEGQLVNAKDEAIPNVWAAGGLTPLCTTDLGPTMGMGYFVGKNIAAALKA